jgi:hypothetical protein
VGPVDGHGARAVTVVPLGLTWSGNAAQYAVAF